MISISHKHKLIYVHIPKTGGSSANQWLKTLDADVESLCQRPHEPVSNIAKSHPAEFASYFTFSIVRNPWARVVSLFHYRQKSKDHQPPHWPSRKDIDSLSFREVVLRSQGQNPEYSDICPPRDAPETAWLEPSCFSWLSIDHKMAVDHVCKLENIQSEIASLGQKLGLAVPSLPHINRSDHRHYADYYDDETKAIIAEKYARDVTEFGYTFFE